MLETAAEPTRCRLLQLLASGERTVTQLASQFPVTRSAISQHLAVLAEVGLVAARKQGRQRYYRIDPRGGGRGPAHSSSPFGATSSTASSSTPFGPHRKETSPCPTKRQSSCRWIRRTRS